VLVLRVEGYLKALDDNNIPINEDIILRTDSEEDLNSKIEAIFDNTIDGVLLWMKTTRCGFKNRNNKRI
jgi:DNA-binding LacI/PurR family transcriptional regulator